MKYSRLIWSLLIGTTLISTSLSAAPSTPPPGSPTTNARGVFADYFLNMTNNPCPANQVVNGFSSSTSNYLKPNCVLVNTLLGGWGFSGNGGLNSSNFLGTTDAVDLIFKTNCVERMRITSAGNVGIGTTIPASGYKLDVNGKSYFRDDIISSGQLIVWATDLSTAPGFTWITDPNTGFFNAGADTIGFATAWVERMRIDASGNVGIGTSTLSKRLTVSDDVMINGILLGRGGGNIASNTVFGSAALITNTLWDRNTVVGAFAMNSNTIGYSNVANGASALQKNTTGYYNIAVGASALQLNTTGYSNTANGASALALNTAGYNNTSNGASALYFNTTGYSNTVVWASALINNTTGYSNTVVWASALMDQSSAGNNTVIGYNTGRGILTGSRNTIIGANVTWLSATLSGNIIIADGNWNQRINIVNNGNMGIGITAPTEKLDVNGNVRAVAFLYSSDRRLKENITPLDHILEKIDFLHGVSFTWKKDGRKDIGLVAQDVETVFPEAVQTGSDGYKRVDYARLVPVLLEAIKAQQKEIEVLQRQFHECHP